MAEIKFEFLDHTADIKMRVYGHTQKDLFENCVLAFSSYVAKGNKIKSRKSKVIEASGIDNESLLYNFLEELIYLVDAENFVVAKAEITVRGKNLRAELFGDDAENYEGLEHVKSPTYAEMYVKKTSEGWQAQFVLDI